MNTFMVPSGISGVNIWVVWALLLWSIAWKGVALWKAARLSHRKWFIVILFLSTFGIIEIFYIYFIARKYNVETEEYQDKE